nr:hypothetical protein [Tanacetum cinerariifolium]
ASITSGPPVPLWAANGENVISLTWERSVSPSVMSLSAMNLLLLLFSTGVTMGGGGLNFPNLVVKISLGILVKGVNLLDPRPSLGWLLKSDLRSKFYRLDWSRNFQGVWTFFLEAAAVSPRIKAAVAVIISSRVFGT